MFFSFVLMTAAQTDESSLYNRLSMFGKLYGADQNPDTAMWLLFITVYVLSVLAYVLGFAKKLKLWQNIVIYIIMLLFSLPLTFFAAFYPVAECLIVIVFVMGMYRYRLYNEKKKGTISFDNKETHK